MHMSLLEAISPTTRELFALPNNWWVLKSPEREFSLIARKGGKPKLPKGFAARGPFKTRDDAAVKALRWELQTRPANLATETQRHRAITKLLASVPRWQKAEVRLPVNPKLRNV